MKTLPISLLNVTGTQWRADRQQNVRFVVHVLWRFTGQPYDDCMRFITPPFLSPSWYMCFVALFRCVDGAFHDEYITFNMPLPLPTGGVLVASFPVEELFWKHELLSASVRKENCREYRYFKVAGEKSS